MSDTLKYLNKTANSSGNAAQSFLSKKLAENKYSATPDIDYNKGILTKDVEAHNASMDDPYAMGEGKVATGPSYPNPDAKSGSGSDGVKGSMNADQVRQKFGLTYEGEKAYDGGTHDGRLQNEDGDIWYKDNDGAIKYLGNIGSFERGSIGQGGDKDSDSKVDSSRFHNDDSTSTDPLLQKAHLARNKEVNDDNYFNSINDVGHAMRYLMEGNVSKPVKDTGRKPIRHSEEIRQAKSRVKEYEERAWNGNTSDDIFGTGGANDGGFEFESNEGINGIGTEGGVAADSSAAKSTASFLDNKKTQVKKEYNFKPGKVELDLG